MTIDPIARLRAADPLQHVAAPNVALLLERLDQLPVAAPRPPSVRRTRRLRVAPLMGAALAAVGIATVLLPGLVEQRRVGVVALAHAALSGPHELIHTVVTVTTTDQSLSSGGPIKVSGSTTTEQWSTSDPPRWRIAFSYPAGGDVVADTHGRLVGPAQVAYDAGTESTYLQKRNTLEVVRGLRLDGPVARAPGTGPLGNDPIATLRVMLARGELRNGATATVAGHKVRRLVGQRHDTFDGKDVVTAIEYDVDSRTYAPVAASIELPSVSPPGIARHRLEIVLHFDQFETLALTTATARLLSIHPLRRPILTQRSALPGRK